MELTQRQETLRTQILRAKDGGRKYWADFELSESDKNFIVENFLSKDGYDVEVKMCPRKLWEVYIKFS